MEITFFFGPKVIALGQLVANSEATLLQRVLIIHLVVEESKMNLCLSNSKAGIVSHTSFEGDAANEHKSISLQVDPSYWHFVSSGCDVIS